MTEDEAKTKWCPSVRFSGGEYGDDPAANCHTDYRNPNYARCIGSACMAWRTTSGTPEPMGSGTAVVHGYCGLAGRPT